MANFGLSRLAVVAPYEPQWRKAKSAVGSEDLLESARITVSLAEAVANATLVIGTGSLARRGVEQPAVSLPDLWPRVEAELARGGRVALVFGSEKHGLTRRDLALCHLLVEIPTHPRQPSMNLGQAVAVCLYELAGRGAIAQGLKPVLLESRLCGPAQAVPCYKAPPIESFRDEKERGEDSQATAGELKRLAEVIEEAMRASSYSPAGMRAANQHDLRLLLRRLALTSRDTRRILGLFRRMIWQMASVRRGKTP
jgi:tRNA/rRNA methyltransferase